MASRPVDGQAYFRLWFKGTMLFTFTTKSEGRLFVSSVPVSVLSARSMHDTPRLCEKSWDSGDI